MIVNDSAINAVEINGIGGELVFAPVFIDRPEIRTSRIICTLSASGFSDVVIPISSITGSLTDLTSTFLIVCPNGLDYAVDIIERASGYFVLTTIEEFSDNTTASVDSDKFAISTITSDQGIRRWSVSIQGKFVNEFKLPNSYNASGLSTISTNGLGKSRIRVDYNPSMRPKDTMLYNNTEMVVGVISYTISVSAKYMTVSES